jgi:acyl carrier protein
MAVTRTVSLDKEDLRRTVAEILEVSPEELTDDVEFVADLGVDSLIALEVVVRLERKYGMKLDESKLDEITCMAAVYEMMLAKLAAV